MRTLGIDPSIRHTGYAILQGDDRRQKALDYGVIHVPQRVSQSQALVVVKSAINKLIEKWEPDEVAVEGIVYVQSHSTAISMGAARAVTLIAAAENNLPIYEYAPRKVKKAVVGKGSASKGQVAFMVRALLSLSETPAYDAGDALAIAMAHYLSVNPAKAAILDRKKI